MKLVLTLKGDGREMVVDSEAIKLMEDDSKMPGGDGNGTHIVFGADLGRVVNESMATIASTMGVVTPKAVASMTVMAIAKKSRK